MFSSVSPKIYDKRGALIFYSDDDNETFERKYGKLLVVDFSKYLKKEGNIEIRLDAKFDTKDSRTQYTITNSGHGHAKD